MYELNTSCHVKIWLGPLSLQNQLRLKNLRALNPDSELSLVYDQRLLTDDEHKLITSLCQSLDISLMDVLADVMPNLNSTGERQLIEYYNQAIKPAQLGGNFAAASDILRWLSPVYRRGIYSDLDVLIDTRGLPKLVSVESPLLFHLGSLQQFRAEYPSINNDIFAVVDEQAAKGKIDAIHQAIHEGCRQYAAGEDAFSTLQQAFKDLPPHPETPILGNLFSSTNLRLGELSLLAQGKSAAKVRAEIINQTKDSDSFYAHHPWRWFLYKTLALGSSEGFNSQLNAYRDAMLLSAVCATTGPLTTLVSSQEYRLYPTTYFDKVIAPISFEHYGLHRYFQSGNNLPLHAGEITYMQLGGKRRNDLSWLDSGKDKIASYESRLESLDIQISLNSETSLNNNKTKPNTSILALSSNKSDQTAALETMAGAHMQQLAELQSQLKMNTDCDKDYSVSFHDCKPVDDTQVCVKTQVNLKTPGFFSIGNSSPKIVDYDCQSRVDTTPTLECSTTIEAQVCDNDIIEGSAYPRLVSSLTSTASQSALAAAIPEAVADVLWLTRKVSYANTQLAKKLTHLLFLAMTGSLLSFTAGMLTQACALELGAEESKAKLLGVAAAQVVNTLQGFNVESLLTMGVSLAAGRFGLWAEKKLIRQAQTLCNNYTNWT